MMETRIRAKRQPHHLESARRNTARGDHQVSVGCLVEGAAQLGMPCVGVLFGTATEAELADAGAAAIARTADEVADALLGNQTRADG